MSCILILNECLRVNSQGMHELTKRKGFKTFYIGDLTPFLQNTLSVLQSELNKLNIEVHILSTFDDLALVVNEQKVQTLITYIPVDVALFERPVRPKRVVKSKSTKYVDIIRLYSYITLTTSHKRFDAFLRAAKSQVIPQKRYTISKVEHLDLNEEGGTNDPVIEKVTETNPYQVLDDLLGKISVRLREGNPPKRYLLSRFINHGLLDVMSFLVTHKENIDLELFLKRDFYKGLMEYLRINELVPKGNGNLKHYEALVNAATGYRLIDACILALKREKYINGHHRYLVASFWICGCKGDWRLADKLFKDYLLDYDEDLCWGNLLYIEGTLNTVKYMVGKWSAEKCDGLEDDQDFILEYKPLKREKII